MLVMYYNANCTHTRAHTRMHMQAREKTAHITMHYHGRLPICWFFCLSCTPVGLFEYLYIICPSRLPFLYRLYIVHISIIIMNICFGTCNVVLKMEIKRVFLKKKKDYPRYPGQLAPPCRSRDPHQKVILIRGSVETEEKT